MNRQLLIIPFLLLAMAALGQSDKQLLRKGNKNYVKEDFEKAATYYRDALGKNPTNEKALFNLGNALYKQQQFDEALNQFKSASEITRDRGRESRAMYNAGNTLLESGKFGESIPFFQRALRLNPNDNDARYNLVYAIKMLQQEQQKNNNQNQDNSRQQQGENQQQNQDQQQQKQDNQQQQQQNNNQQQGQQNRQPQLSKQEAERLIKALINEEKNTMEKVNQQRFKTGTRITREKDW